MAVVSGMFWELAARERVDFFIERVPTESNVADYPTRMDDEACRRAVEHVLRMRYVEPQGISHLEFIFRSLYECPNEYPDFFWDT